MSLADLALPWVKLLPAEAAHTATIKGLKAGVGLPRIDPTSWNTSVTLPRSGLKLPNPVGLAAGFDKNAEVFTPMARFGFGLVECGTVTPLPQPGNPKPRLFRLTEDEAVINRMGFNNNGLLYFTRRLRKTGNVRIPIGANVGANKTSEDRIGDYERGIREVYPFADYITINISSPNTPGLRGLQDKASLQELLERSGTAWRDAEQETERRSAPPVFLKVAPDLDETAIQDIISVVQSEGAWLSGLIISNTTLARPESLKNQAKTEAGGLSGSPLLQPSTEVLKAFARALGDSMDLIGVGGIASGADAYAKIRAGAHAVQLYSALVFHGPSLVAKINEELAALLKADSFSNVIDAVGADLN